VVAIRCGAYTVGRTRFAWGSQASRALSGGLTSVLVAEHHEDTKPALSHMLCLGLAGLTRAVAVR